MDDDPLRLFLVLRRGAIAELDRAAALAGAAAVACVADPANAEAVAAWRERPGKVCLRARNEAEWERVLAEPHALAGDAGGEGVVAIPPRRRSERGPVLERLQAMASALTPPPLVADPDDDRPAVTYLLNPAAPMSSGKAVAQVAHAAVMAAAAAPAWVAGGCPGRVVAPGPTAFAAAAAGPGCLARVVDAGLTEVPPGTVTVVALAPGPAAALPAALRGPAVVVEADLGASVEAVWAAVTDPGGWFGEHLTVAGGRFTERWTTPDGREVITRGAATACAPPHALELSWADEGWPAPTTVRLELRPAVDVSRSAGDVTRLTLTHTGWAALPAGLAEAHRAGWERHAARLDEHLSGR